MIIKKEKRKEVQLLSDEALEAYMNKRDIHINVNADALYKYYNDRYREQVKTAMQGTQTASLTGGYGSSYARRVGQQTSSSYMQQLGDVLPALYKTDQSRSQQEQLDREYALAGQKHLDANARFLLEQERKNSTAYQGDDAAVGTQYGNGRVSEGSIKTMQRVLGLPETGQWTDQERTGSGNLTADAAWEAYQQGKLQGRSKSGMSMDEWAEFKKKQFQSSGKSNTNGNTSAVESFIAGTVTEDQAAERGVNSTEWKMAVVDRLNRVSLSADEFEQLEKYYGLDIKGGKPDLSGTADHSAQKISYAQYRKNTAAKKVSDLQAAVKQYFTDYQLFVNSAVSDIQNVGYRNAASMRDLRVRTAEELRKRADALASSLRMNGDILSGDYSELLTQIVSTKTGVDSIMDAFGGQVTYYSQWDTEEAYQRAKAYYDTWGHYLEADDFAYYSALGAAIQNPSVNDAEGYLNIFGWRPFAEEVGNIVTYSRDNYDRIAAMSEGGRYDVVGDLRYKSMTDDEVAIYNYLLAKEGKERAEAFLTYIEEYLNAREGKKIADLVTSIDIPVVEELATVLYGLGAGMDQWVSGTRQFFTNEQQPVTVTQYANSAIADSLDGFGKYVYTGANVIGNMAPSILLSYVTAGLGAPAAASQIAGSAAVGMSAAGNAYGSALRDGYSVRQARAYSTLVGAAEGTLQYLLGGIGSLGGITDDLIKAKISMIDNSLLRISAKLGADVISEITEEELQNFLEPAFRSIIFGEAYDVPTIDEIIETAILTAGTTLLLGGSDTVSKDLSESIRFAESGEKIMGTDGGVEALMKLANEVAGVSSAQLQSALTKQMDKVNQKPTARSVGQLSETVRTASNKAMQAEVAKGLMSKGIHSKKADGIAEAIVASLNGQELTRTQRNLLSSAKDSPSVQDVISDTMEMMRNGIDSTPGKVYDEVNAMGGLENREKAALWDLARQSVDVFGNEDYATSTEDSAPHQVQNTFSEGIQGVGTDTVTYRRVQGGGGHNASQVRIIVNADGSSSIPNKESNLSISIDDGEHAQYFLNKRGGDAQIIEIDVPKWFDDFLQENAIPQVNYKTNPRNQGGAAPKITDITTPGNCFELPAPWIEWLEEYGRNTRIVNP